MIPDRQRFPADDLYSLKRSCWYAMIPEPLQFTQDADGSWHFASGAPPLKTVFDVHALKFLFITPHESRGVVEIRLDGKTVIYDRIAVGPHGEWICALRIGHIDGDASG